MVKVESYLNLTMREVLLKGLKKFENLDEKQIKKLKISAKKSLEIFSIFSHYKKLSFI